MSTSDQNTLTVWLPAAYPVRTANGFVRYLEWLKSEAARIRRHGRAVHIVSAPVNERTYTKVLAPDGLAYALVAGK